jgi:hypothetical protein
MKNLIRNYFGDKYAYLILLPLALLMFPHKGIIHDTRLYVFDILNIAHEGIFANDILTIVGTQDKYTLFSIIAAPLYKILSLWAATSAVFIVGQLVWFSGLIALVAKFAEDEKTAFFGLLSAFLLPTAYFGFSVLSYGEGFATPRLFVEGLTFWSIWCFCNRSYLISALLVLVALSLHPIMGLIIAALLVGILLQEGRRWWLIFGAASIAGIAVILVSGVVPTERFTAVLEGDWFYVVNARAKYLFVTEWQTKDWARIMLAASITVPMIAIYSGWQRRLIISALLVGAAGLVVSLIGADMLHNVLLSQVQTSRTIWFAYLLGNVGFGVVVATMYRKSEEDGDVFFFLYTLAWTVDHLIWPVPGLVLGIVTSSLAYLRITGKIAGIPSLFRRLTYLLTIILFVWLIFLRLKFWIEPENRDAVFPTGDGFVGVTGFTQVELVLVVFIVFAAVRLRLNIPAYATKGLLILLAVWAVFVWDRRSPDNRGLEGDYRAAEIREQIPKGAEVYWEGTVKGAWFLLGRPSYFADALGAGVVFSQDLAREYFERGKIAGALDDVDYIDIWRPFKNAGDFRERLKATKTLRRSDLIEACVNAPELDFLVLTRQVGGAYLMAWQLRSSDRAAETAPAESDSAASQFRYLYRCADFR